MTDQREDFEEAAARMGYSLKMAGPDTIEYMSVETETAWNMWQECCDKAACGQGDAEPVAFVFPGDLEKLRSTECAVNAYSVEMGDSDLGETLPLYTHTPAAKVPDWTNRLNTCKHHGDDHESCAVYGGRVPCDAEGEEAVGWVPRINGEIDYDCFTVNPNRADFWGFECGWEVVSLFTTPQPDKWIPCSERLPTEADADCNGSVWVKSKLYGVKLMQRHSVRADFESHWMPTGLRKPEPPQPQEGE